jgi:integrase
MPKTKLTKRVVDSFCCPPGVARTALFDSEIPGFHVEALASGKKVYRLKWKRNGQQGRETLGEQGALTVEQARARAITLRGQLFDGLNPQEARRELLEAKERELSLQELVERWLIEGPAAAPNKRQSSWSADARKLRIHIIPLLGDRMISALSRSDIELAQHAIATGKTARIGEKIGRNRSIVRGGEGIARSSVLSLSSCLTWAVDRGLLTENPCFKVKKSKVRNVERFLTKEEAERLLRTLEDMKVNGEVDARFADIVQILLLTGARKSEIQGLRWQEVDFQRAIIRLPRHRSKTGEKTIPINSRALEIIQKRQHLSSGASVSSYVFPSWHGNQPVVGLQKAWERIRYKANLVDVRIHDLRHSFASFAAANGASLYVIGKALGHTQPATTARYAHLTADPVRKMSEDVANTIFALPPLDTPKS